MRTRAAGAPERPAAPAGRGRVRGADRARSGRSSARPRLAVAVSGGPTAWPGLLAAAGRARGAAPSSALIVDHGLRPEVGGGSPAGRRRGCARARHRHRRSCAGPAPSPPPASRRRPAPRATACSATGAGRPGILHLLLGHHRDDQAETVALRRRARQRRRRARRHGGGARARRAAPAAAAARRAQGARCSATLRGAGQPWLDDPSNLRAARSRAAGCAQRPGFDAARLARRLRSTARRRAARDGARGRAWLARQRAHRSGWASSLLAGAALAAAPPEIAAPRRAAGAADRRRPALSATPGAPRAAARAAAAPALASGRTLGGCRILPRRRRRC